MSNQRDEHKAMKAFISYSRNDHITLEKIAGALQKNGIIVDFDLAVGQRANIDGGIAADDDWWQRLQQMIANSDVMVFLVSTNSTKSSVCEEEIAYARAVGKRVIPVLIENLNFGSLPPRLAALNIKLNLSPTGSGFEEVIDELVEVINRDSIWLRQARRYSDRVNEWDANGRPTALLLRNEAVSRIFEWASDRPSTEAPLGELITDFMTSSKARAIRENRRRNIIQTTLVLALLAIVAFLTLMSVANTRDNSAFVKSAIMTSAIDLIDAGDSISAARWLVSASRDTALEPSVKGTRFHLGRSVANARLESIFREFDSSISAFDVHYNDDQIQIGVGTENGSIYVLQKMPEHEWSIFSDFTNTQAVAFLRFSNDGQKMVGSSSRSNTALLYHRSTSNLWNKQFLHGHSDTISNAWFSSNDETLATSSRDQSVLIWSLSTEDAQQVDRLQFIPDYGVGGTNHIAKLTFLSSGTEIIMGTAEGEIYLIKKDPSNNWYKENFEYIGGKLSGLNLSDDETHFVTTSPMITKGFGEFQTSKIGISIRKSDLPLHGRIKSISYQDHYPWLVHLMAKLS